MSDYIAYVGDRTWKMCDTLDEANQWLESFSRGGILGGRVFVDVEQQQAEIERLTRELGPTIERWEGQLRLSKRLMDDRDAARAEIERLRIEVDAAGSNVRKLIEANAEIERLMAIITDRNCAIHELQDVMEWQRDKLSECRRLLREVTLDPEPVKVGDATYWRVHVWSGWLEAARAAGGSTDDQRTTSDNQGP